MSWLDWLVVGSYIALIVFLGLRASRGQRTVESHLRASKSLPAWAVVFSVLATEISAATYIGVPEKGFVGNWEYLQLTLGSLLGKLAVATLFLHLYWRLDLTSVYGFLRTRIGPRSQRATAWAFLGGRLISSGVRLFIAALALKTAAGVDIVTSIAVMAALSTACTFLGGLRAVVWTDVAQGAMFVIGAATALIFGLSAIDAPLGDLAREVGDAAKTQIFTLDDQGKGWLASNRPLPVSLLGAFFLVLASHGTDQENVQHLLNTKTNRASGRSIAWSGIMALPVVALFLSVGTMLWLYHRHVTPVAYSAANSREIFPNFIVHELPAGLRGLVLAGLFAAAISGATLNAATTIWISDLRPRPGGESMARVRKLTVFFGAMLFLVAWFFAWRAQSDRSSLIDTALSAMTILYGGILGTFLVALLYRRRGSDRSTVLGLLAGVAVGALAFFQKEIFGWSVNRLDWAYTIPLAASVTLAVAACGRRSPPVAPSA